MVCVKPACHHFQTFTHLSSQIISEMFSITLSLFMIFAWSEVNGPETI